MTGVDRVASVYSIIVGVSILVLWTLLITTSSIPEFDTNPIEIILHITAELSTGFFLIIGGYGLWKEYGWRYPVHFLSMGMLFYTAIVSPGYYGDKGEWQVVGIFAILLSVGLVITFFMVKGLLRMENESDEKGRGGG
jgi:hypothetical protein